MIVSRRNMLRYICHSLHCVFKSSDQPLFICSAFITPACSGMIYVEAEKEAHVKQAIKGLTYVYNSRIALVPIKAMVQAVTVKAAGTAVRAQVPGACVILVRSELATGSASGAVGCTAATSLEWKTARIRTP